jgi:peroxiredoxin
MKRSIIAALLCMAPCLLKAQGKFVLQGKVGNVKDGVKVLLMQEGAEHRIDSAILKNGRFSFTGRLTDPVKATLILFGTHGTNDLGFFLENGAIYIDVNSPDSLKNAVITGSALNDDNKRLQAALQSVMDKNAGSGKEVSGYNALRKEKRMIYRKFISDNPKSLLSLLIMEDAAGEHPDYDNLVPLFNMLSKEVRNSAGGKKMAKEIDSLKIVRIGAMAPTFTMNDTSGVPVKLSSFRGRYVLLDFWGPLCSPCRAEHPHLIKAYNKYKNKNFTIVSVAMTYDARKDTWLKSIHEDKMPWTQLSDMAPKWGCKAAKLYTVFAIPRNFLIDPSGRIIAKDLFREALDEKLTELLD